MKKFRIVVDATFDAEDIDDAMQVVADHFYACIADVDNGAGLDAYVGDIDDWDVGWVGDIDIRPVA